MAPDAAQPTALLRLADSLRGLSPRLAQFGAEYEAQQAQAGEAEALGLRLSTETRELTARINSGDIDPEVNRLSLEMGHGEDIARQNYEQDVRRRYLGENTFVPDSSVNGESNAFNRDTDDLDAWFAGVVIEGERRVPNTPAARHEYRPL